MPAPTLTSLPPPPTRANPADFSARADSFLGALPTLVTQINALVTYWNAELDTTAFVNRAQATTLTATMTFTAPPVLLASATSGRQTALTIGKGATQRQSIGIENDGSLNIVPLNGALAALSINGARVFTTAYLPTPAAIGALPATAYTAEDVLAKLQSVTGGSGSTLDAASLAGEAGSFYRNASNLNAGTVPDARLPTNIVRSTRRVNTNTGSGLTGGGALTADLTIAVDSTVARRDAVNTYTQHQNFNSGAIYIGALANANAHIWFQTIGGALRGLIWSPPASSLMRYRSYNVAGDAFREFSHDGATGTLSSTAFDGNGAALSNLNASALTAGTVADARLPASVVRTSLTITAGDGLNGGGTLGANRSFAVDSSVVRTSRQVIAGNGLTGGGNLGADRTISMGTPSTITADSLNTVSATSHTHAITRETVGTLMSRLAFSEDGAYMFASTNFADQSLTLIGQTVAGSRLRPCNAQGRAQTGFIPTGSWRCCGATINYNAHVALTGDNERGNEATLWQKVS